MRVRTLTLAYSPCPNDTFLFEALATAQIRPAGLRFTIALHDIDELNRHAFAGRYDLLKVSCHTWFRLKQHYRLLDVGAALGFGCGPLVLSRTSQLPDRMGEARIALPGRFTTASLLFRLWRQDAGGHWCFLPYDRIVPQLVAGKVDYGVVIHETRFTYQQAGLQAVVDLGAWWEAQTGLPLPLGCLVIRRTIPEAVVRQVEESLRQSLQWAWQRPVVVSPYVRRHACEMDDGVIERHIRLYVNEFTHHLGETGRRAFAHLEALARRGGSI